MEINKAGLAPSVLAHCAARERDDALLSSALEALHEGRTGDALVAAESFCAPGGRPAVDARPLRWEK